MSKLLTYSGIVTKVKAMNTRLITMEEFNKLSSMNSVSNIIAFLKKQPAYAPYFATLDEYSLHRGQTECIIQNAIYKDYEKIFRFSTAKQRKILKLIFFRYEINVLKGCLLHVFNKDTVYDLTSVKEFFNGHSKLDLDSLVSTKSMEEFIAQLKGTEYHSLFLTLFQSHHSTFFDYGTQLDIYYYTKMWKLKDKVLKGKELESFTLCLGKQIDFLNLLWIYRSKKFYNIDASKILSIIIPVNYKLKKEELTNLLESSSIEDFMKILSTTSYHLKDTSVDEDSLEKIYFSTMNDIYTEIGRKYPFSMSPIQCYLFLKEQEIDKLTTVVECIRYGLEPSMTMKYVS